MSVTDQSSHETAALDEIATTLDSGDSEAKLEAYASLHKRALTSIVRRLRDDPRGKELLFELVDDEAVHMVLAVHGLIRPDPLTRARQVLSSAEPVLRDQGCTATLLSIEDAVVRLRFEGGTGCNSAAAASIKTELEAALRAAIPALTGVKFVYPPRAPIQLGTIGRRPQESSPSSAELGWVKTFSVERMTPGSIEAVSLRTDEGKSVEAVIVSAAGKLSAYVNECAHQGLPLDNSLIDASQGTLTCPWHGFCYDTTEGECLTMPGARLTGLPLRVHDGHIWVRAVT